MKNAFLFSSFGIVLVLILGAFTVYSEQEKTIPGIPEDVNQIIQNHCYGCHNNDGKSEDAVEDLNFDEWEDYNPMKKAAKLNDICEAISEGKMPPEKFLKKYPDKKLNDEQIKVICQWTKKEDMRQLR